MIMIGSTSHSNVQESNHQTGYHLAIHFTVKTSGIYRSGNQSDIHAILLGMLRDSEPLISKKLHEHRSRKPWSFSRLFFDKASPVPGSSWVHVREGTAGHFFMNTMSSDVYTSIMEASMSRRKYRVNDIDIELGDIDCDQAFLDNMKPSREVVMTFHSATFFRDHDDEKKMETLDPGKLIRFQCDALEKTGIATIDRDMLAKHVVIVSQDTRRASGMVHESGKDIVIYGFTGIVVLRCTSPDPAVQKDFALVMAAMPYLGCGSRTSMGFGHCSVRLLDRSIRGLK